MTAEKLIYTFYLTNPKFYEKYLLTVILMPIKKERGNCIMNMNFN